MKNPYNFLLDLVGEEMTYKDFCKITNEPIMPYDSKKAQIKRMSSYMDLETRYGKVTIKSIYDENEMLLIDRKSKFTEYIEDLLIMYLAKNEEKSVTLTYKELSEYFYMVNENYYKVKHNRGRHLDDFDLNVNSMFVDKEDIIERKYYDIGVFFGVTDKLIKEIIKNSLKSLKKRSLVLYQDTFKLYKTTYIKESELYVTETYICDKKQRETFLDIRRSVMNEFNIDKLQDVVYLPKETRDTYFSRLMEDLKKCDELHNCDRYANAFTIEYAKDGIEHEYKRLFSTNKSLINSNMQFKLLTTKELQCINGVLKKQFVDKLIENVEG